MGRFGSLIKRLAMVKNSLIAWILQQATARYSRSTVLRPLGWLAGIFVTALLGALRFNAQPEVIGRILAILGITAFLYMAAYVFCLVKDRDALRTESYLIQKTALEKSFVGDTDTGIFEVTGGETLGKDIAPRVDP